MDIQSVARLALDIFKDTELAAIMVAIAKGESSFDETNGADSANQLISLRNKGWNIAQSSIDNAMQWSCPPNTGAGYSSWGLWQINMGWNNPAISALAGSADPCLMASWLTNPTNNAIMAKKIYDSQGLNAWTVYKTGEYQNYLSDARNAVNSLITKPEISETIEIITSKPISFLFVATIGIAALAGVILFSGKKKNPQPSNK